jgi:hypothetical protein
VQADSLACQWVISVDAIGRMGNTMFQFAFAHAAARRLGTSFVLGPAPLWEDFALGPWGRRSVRATRKLALRMHYGKNGPRQITVGNDEDPATVLTALRDGVAYNGFFQSEQYFADYADEVRALLTVRPERRATFAARYGDLGSYTCVHVRRGDYLDNGWALPAEYFRAAFASLSGGEDRPVLVVSDDRQRARRELGDLPGVRIEDNDAITDMLLLAHADRLVLSNSSFSWWGAWLNTRPDARVVAPQHWVGFREGAERPLGVLPERWERMPVG